MHGFETRLEVSGAIGEGSRSCGFRVFSENAGRHYYESIMLQVDAIGEVSSESNDAEFLEIEGPRTREPGPVFRRHDARLPIRSSLSIRSTRFFCGREEPAGPLCADSHKAALEKGTESE